MKTRSLVPRNVNGVGDIPQLQGLLAIIEVFGHLTHPSQLAWTVYGYRANFECGILPVKSVCLARSSPIMSMVETIRDTSGVLMGNEP